MTNRNRIRSINFSVTPDEPITAEVDLQSLPNLFDGETIHAYALVTSYSSMSTISATTVISDASLWASDYMRLQLQDNEKVHYTIDLEQSKDLIYIFFKNNPKIRYRDEMIIVEGSLADYFIDKYLAVFVPHKLYYAGKKYREIELSNQGLHQLCIEKLVRVSDGSEYKFKLPQSFQSINKDKKYLISEEEAYLLSVITFLLNDHNEVGARNQYSLFRQLQTTGRLR